MKKQNKKTNLQANVSVNVPANKKQAKAKQGRFVLCWKRNKRRFGAFAAALMFSLLMAAPALAVSSDPLTIVNNLSDFIFSIIKAVGVIVLGWGIVQVGMSIQSHDASQRTQGFLCLFGGLMIAFAKEILSAIGAI